MLIELFSLAVTVESLRVIICSKLAISLQRGSVDPKLQVEGIAPTNRSFFANKLDKLSFVRYKKLSTSFFRFVTIHAFDGRTLTVGQTDGQNSHRKTASAFHAAR